MALTLDVAVKENSDEGDEKIQDSPGESGTTGGFRFWVEARAGPPYYPVLEGFTIESFNHNYTI